MIDKILVEDISKRAHHIYNQCQELVKEYMPEKQCNINFEFLIKEDKEINGLSLSENDKDYVEINSGVIELHYNYFFDVMKQDKNKLIRFITSNCFYGQSRNR